MWIFKGHPICINKKGNVQVRDMSNQSFFFFTEYISGNNKQTTKTLATFHTDLPSILTEFLDFYESKKDKKYKKIRFSYKHLPSFRCFITTLICDLIQFLRFLELFIGFNRNSYANFYISIPNKNDIPRYLNNKFNAI